MDDMNFFVACLAVACFVGAVSGYFIGRSERKSIAAGEPNELGKWPL